MIEPCALPVSRRVYLAFDDRPFNKKAKADFRASRKAEKQFGAKLRRMVRNIADIVESSADGTLSSAYKIGVALARYAEALTPWAEAVTRMMHQEIASRDKAQWKIYAAQMGAELRNEIETAPTGTAMHMLLDEQVKLIKSIPLDAAKRVHELTLKGLTEGTRSTDLITEIMRTSEVTRSRATLIARTETARTASILTQVRAQHIGSTHFIWRTSRDAQVRKSHKKLEGKSFAWNDPPECDPGHHALPGQIWNCFPGHVLVDASGARKIFRTEFTGDLVEIGVGDELIQVTPNHPLMTAKGWTKAADIKKGDKLAVCEGADWQTFNDIFNAQPAGGVLMPGDADFHGDDVSGHGFFATLPYVGDWRPKTADDIADMIREAVVKATKPKEDAPSFKYELVPVKSVAKRDYAGHVYTLETAVGCYSVGKIGVIAKNCRCVAEPIIPTNK